MSSAVLANGYPAAVQRVQLLNFEAPEHLIPPIVVIEDSTLSQVFTSFRNTVLTMISRGTPAPALMGDRDFISVDPFFSTEDRPGDNLTINGFACELLKGLQEMDVFVRLAWVGQLAHYLEVRIHVLVASKNQKETETRKRR